MSDPEVARRPHTWRGWTVRPDPLHGGAWLAVAPTGESYGPRQARLL